jgi:hypothetical protein
MFSLMFKAFLFLDLSYFTELVKRIMIDLSSSDDFFF